MGDILQNSGSLRRRLMLALVIGGAILTVLLFIIVRGYATQIAQKGQDNILEASVSSILDAAILRNGQVRADFPYAAFSMLDTDLDDRVFYAIFQDGNLISGYSDLHQTLPKPDQATLFQTSNYKDTPIRVASRTRVLIGASGRTEVLVSVAQTQDSLSQTLNAISKNVALLGAGFFALVILLSYWVSAITIRPLSRLTDAVQRRGPQDLSPFRKPVPQEMTPLVSSLNSLMGRLDHSLTQSEDFIAEAAHRVRTPLATVRSYADATLQRVSKKENREALRSMVRAIDESSRAAGQLLDHAMITFRADHLEREKIDLRVLVQEIVSRLEPIAGMKDVRLNVHCDEPVEIKGDFILLQNAFRNLMDNALKFSPNEGQIDIWVGANTSPFVKITDQGPGFPPEDIETLTDRFARGNNADGIVGSGLGLTIARDVAVAHGGKLQLKNLDKGGACVVFSF